MYCFATFVLEVQLLVVLLLLLVGVELFYLLVDLLLCSKSLFSGVLTIVLHSLLFFFCVLDVFVRCDIEVLLSELQDVEVVDLPLFDVQFNDAVVTKMSFQNRRCDALGVNFCRIVVRCHSLDVHKACSVDERYLSAMCFDLLLRPSLLLRLIADVLSVKMWIGDFVVVNDGDVLSELLRLY